MVQTKVYFVFVVIEIVNRLLCKRERRVFGDKVCCRSTSPNGLRKLNYYCYSPNNERTNTQINIRLRKERVSILDTTKLKCLKILQ